MRKNDQQKETEMGKQALPGRRLNAFAEDPDTLVVIGIDTDDGPEHALHDPRIHLPLVEETVLNLMSIGVREPVIVRKNGDVPEVTDGRRRVLHAREANRRLRKLGETELLVPVMLAKGDDDLMLEIGISLNEHRVNDGVMAKVDKAVRMLARNGEDLAKTAVAFGVTTQTIRSWVKIAGVSAKVRKAIDAGTISATAAAKLAALSRAEQDEELVKLTANGKTTVAAADRAAKTKKTGAKVSPAPKKKIVRKLLASDMTQHSLCAAGGRDVSQDDFILGVKWALGDVTADEISGLQEILDEL